MFVDSCVEVYLNFYDTIIEVLYNVWMWAAPGRLLPRLERRTCVNHFGFLFGIVEFYFNWVNFYNKSKTLHINENKRIKWRLC